MTYLLSRLREPSTYAGLAALAGAFGVSIPIAWVQALSGLGVAIAGVLAVVVPEKNAGG